MTGYNHFLLASASASEIGVSVAQPSLFLPESLPSPVSMGFSFWDLHCCIHSSQQLLGNVQETRWTVLN